MGFGPSRRRGFEWFSEGLELGLEGWALKSLASSARTSRALSRACWAVRDPSVSNLNRKFLSSAVILTPPLSPRDCSQVLQRLQSSGFLATSFPSSTENTFLGQISAQFRTSSSPALAGSTSTPGMYL